MTIPAEAYTNGWHFGLIIPTLILITVTVNYVFIPVFYTNNIDNCYAVSVMAWHSHNFQRIALQENCEILTEKLSSIFIDFLEAKSL